MYPLLGPAGPCITDVLIERHVKKPREISVNPSFAELVLYYLPSSEWSKGDTINSEECRNGTRRFAAGPETSEFDRYHYRLLKEHPDCDQEQLSKAWTEWLRLGEYKFGEEQRQNLIFANKAWARNRQTYTAIQKGLYGTLEEQEEFQESWHKTAKIELELERKKDDLWETWWSVTELNKADAMAPVREPSCFMLPGTHADNYLGRRIYHDRNT
jgi:hypothetical protein